MARVFVLGAGASRAVNSGAPLMANLLPDALEHARTTQASSRSVSRATPVEAFLKDVYASRGDRIPPFEDVLSLLDFCIGNDAPLSGCYTVARLRTIRNNLIYLMGRVLQLSMAGLTNEPLMGSFLNAMTDGDAIISLNYDLIVDNALRQRFGFVNYHVPTRNLSTYPIPKGRPEPGIYKLHGSLNWLYCPLCRELETTDGRKEGLESLIRDVRCSQCQTRLEPILIAPTFLKNYGNSFILQLWHEAEHKLQHADEIVFVGYSLPDADIMLRVYLTRAIHANHLIKGRRCPLTVVDKCDTEDCAARERYERLFGPVNYYPHGFDQYILNEMRPI